MYISIMYRKVYVIMELKDGRRLVVSMAKVSDAKELIEYMNRVVSESDNLSMGHGEFNVSLKDEEELIKKYDMSQNSVIIIGRINNQIASVLMLSGSNKKRFIHKVVLGISVSREYWNIGVAKSMMEKAIDFAKDNIYIEQIYLEVRNDNDIAINLYKNLGFESYGVHKKAIKIDNEYYDVELMSLEL